MGQRFLPTAYACHACKKNPWLKSLGGLSPGTPVEPSTHLALFTAKVASLSKDLQPAERYVLWLHHCRWSERGIAAVDSAGSPRPYVAAISGLVPQSRQLDAQARTELFLDFSPPNWLWATSSDSTSHPARESIAFTLCWELARGTQLATTGSRMWN